MAWTITALRNGRQGPVSHLEEAEFYFGRTESDIRSDLYGSRRSRQLMTLCEGASSLIREFDLVEQALETGFSIEMSDCLPCDGVWKEFSMVAGFMEGVRWENPRSLYSCLGLSCTIEFEDQGFGYNELPPIIWIRVTALSMSTIVWAISNGVYECPKGFQSTLHQWVDLDLAPMSNVGKLVLPGPPNTEYDFLE